MPTDRTVNQTVFQHLLDHFWQAVDNKYPRDFDQAPKGYLISYSKLIDISGVPLNPRNAGGPLFAIAGYCDSKSWPPIHALVVTKEGGYPGEGFFRAPGTDHSHLSFEKAFSAWQSNVTDCIEQGPAKFPRSAPTIS